MANPPKKKTKVYKRGRTLDKLAITVRKGAKKDISFVCAVEKLVFSDPWGEEAVDAHTESAHLCLFIAESGGEPVGYLLGSCIPPEGEIYRVASLPSMRRQGIGHALCERFFSLSDDVYLEVRCHNAAARALYEKLGFSLVGERKGYYKNPTEDACLYRRQKDEDHRL